MAQPIVLTAIPTPTFVIPTIGELIWTPAKVTSVISALQTSFPGIASAISGTLLNPTTLVITLIAGGVVYTIAELSIGECCPECPPGFTEAPPPLCCVKDIPPVPPPIIIPIPQGGSRRWFNGWQGVRIFHRLYNDAGEVVFGPNGLVPPPYEFYLHTFTNVNKRVGRDTAVIYNLSYPSDYTMDAEIDLEDPAWYSSDAFLPFNQNVNLFYVGQGVRDRFGVPGTANPNEPPPGTRYSEFGYTDLSYRKWFDPTYLFTDSTGELDLDSIGMKSCLVVQEWFCHSLFATESDDPTNNPIIKDEGCNLLSETELYDSDWTQNIIYQGPNLTESCADSSKKMMEIGVRYAQQVKLGFRDGRFPFNIDLNWDLGMTRKICVPREINAGPITIPIGEYGLGQKLQLEASQFNQLIRMTQFIEMARDVEFYLRDIN